MDIIVPIKQVPETGNVKIDEEKGTMIREGVESIVNPLDLYAIEVALQLKEDHGGQLTVISMGPTNAEKAVREAISMGSDDGVLISDRAFAGSDTWATSYALSTAIKRLPPFDLIITGVRATDGDTGQVGPGIAAFLDLPLSTYTSRIKEITPSSIPVCGGDRRGGTITVERLVEAGYETLRLPLPCLLTVVKEISYPRLPTLRGKQRSRSKEVPIWGPGDLNADRSCLGLKGSLVRVVKINRPKVARNGRIIDVGRLGIKGAVCELVDFLNENRLARHKTQDTRQEGRRRKLKLATPVLSLESSMWAGVWTFAETKEGRLRPVSYELLARGRGLADKLGTELSAVVLGADVDAKDLQELILRGADKVYLAEDPALEHFLVEPYANVMEHLIRTLKPEIVIAGATTVGRTLMPYVAIRVKAGLTADCTGLDIAEETANLLQMRPAIGGNIMATIETPEHRPQMATVRPKSIAPPPRLEGRKGEVIPVQVPAELLSSRVGRLDFRSTEEEETNIQDADKIVAGGRGLKKGENFVLIRELAENLGAAVGASRDAVDRGWISYPHQVGLSGKTVTPKLYMAVGISGAIQHLAGMKTADTIVAINNDPDAQIFQVADFGIIGDLFEVVPALVEELGKRKTQDTRRKTQDSLESRVLCLESSSPVCNSFDGFDDLDDPIQHRVSSTPAYAGGYLPSSLYDYNPVTEAIIDELARIVGGRFVLTDREKLEPYSHDEVSEQEYSHMPEVVVKPRTAEEISEIVKLANRENIPVTPRGAGSGLSGGAVPICGGIVLSVERMNEILEIDEANMMVVVEPGVVTNDINEAIAEKGLFYAGYPMSVETCFIGGNVAENAGGGKAIKYGVTERYIMGLEVVTPTGEILKLGGKRVKDVTGYNLKQLMVGSEGTLGIITKIIIKLLPLPKAKVDLLVLFPDVKSAIAVVPKIMTIGGIIPTAVEFMDQLSVRASCEYLNEHLPYQEAGAMLLIEVDGSDEEIVERDYDTIGELCFGNGALEVYVADNYTTQERIWSVRRNIAEAFKVISPHQSLEDIVVPTASIPDIMPELERISEEYGVQIPCYGHAGDGNLHATIVKAPETGMDEWQMKLPKALEDLYRAVKKLGGTISGEHGIGSKRKSYMHIVADEAELEFMRKIKRALDPNNILNPGKIFDV